MVREGSDMTRHDDDEAVRLATSNDERGAPGGGGRGFFCVLVYRWLHSRSLRGRAVSEWGCVECVCEREACFRIAACECLRVSAYKVKKGVLVERHRDGRRVGILLLLSAMCEQASYTLTSSERLSSSVARHLLVMLSPRSSETKVASLSEEGRQARRASRARMLSLRRR